MMVTVSGAQAVQTLALPVWIRVLGWLATLIMTITVGAFAWSVFA
jgi:hypothetical protein